jgi:hypothetical protein
MRKFSALTLIALMSMMLALAAVGCGGQQAQEQAPAETPATEMPPAESMPDTAMQADTTMSH